ncbi:MAG TPA: hypothetical protein VNI77_02450 [Nitrososphaera sp.]|nr:hypothetical protein [Nitrososphaera sp.]
MRHGWTIAFVILSLLTGGIIVQLPLAAADDSNSPFTALWSAIFDLQNRDEQLQAQIDELRAEKQLSSIQSSGDEPAVLVSDLYATIEVQPLEHGRTIVHITAGNNGPDRAAGVKLTAFYLMPLFEINSIDGDLCMDKSRGIIECIIGTIDQGQEVVITIDTTPRESGRVNTWTVDVSTTTDDADFSNNHVTYEFETGSSKQIEEVIEIREAEKHEVEGADDDPKVIAKPEENNDNDNSTEVEQPENAGNQTSVEQEEETTSENQSPTTESLDSGSTNSNSNSTETDIEDQEDSENKVAGDSSASETNAPEDESEQSEEEESIGDSNEEMKEEQQTDSESSEPPTEQQTDEQGASEESASEQAEDESNKESPAEDNSESKQEESTENG